MVTFVTLVLHSKYLTIITKVSDNIEVHMLEVSSDVMFSQKCPQPTPKKSRLFSLKECVNIDVKTDNSTQYYHDSDIVLT